MPDNEDPLLKYPQYVEAKRVNYNVKIEPTETYIYSNVAGLSISPWDFRIHFAEVQPTSNTEVKTKTVVGIVMPPEHAAGLALLLLAQLTNYELQFGPIRNPEWARLRSDFKPEDLNAATDEGFKSEPKS
jgi:hypothetical protein